MAEQAITMQARGSGLLPRQLAGFIFEDVARNSAIQQLFPEQPLPAEGLSIPVMTGKPTAAWVNEAGRKPISDAAMDFVTMDPEKIAVIVPFSEEFLRTDRVNMFQFLRPAIAEAFALAFDWAAIHGAGPTGTLAGGPFPAGQFLAATTNRVVLGTHTAANGGIYKDLVGDATGTGTGVMDTLSMEASGPYRLSGWVFDEIAEPIFLGAVDVNGVPLLSGLGAAAPSTILGRRFALTPTFTTDAPGGVNDPSQPLLGIGGDLRQARWGRGIGISYSISREATLFKADGTPMSLWQDNLVALRAEAEFGWVINDVEAFVRVYPAGTTFA